MTKRFQFRLRTIVFGRLRGVAARLTTTAARTLIVAASAIVEAADTRLKQTATAGQPALISRGAWYNGPHASTPLSVQVEHLLGAILVPASFFGGIAADRTLF